MITVIRFNGGGVPGLIGVVGKAQFLQGIGIHIGNTCLGPPMTQAAVIWALY
jgi:hypothetical protein